MPGRVKSFLWPSGSSSLGRARPCQGRGSGFEARLPLHHLNSDSLFGGASDLNADPNASPTVVVASASLELHVMHVILFGAGASYGSGAVHPEPPPLGDQLFDLLARAFLASRGALPN